MEDRNDTKPFAISKRVLLGVYGIVPLIGLLILLDSFFWGSYLKHLFGINTINAPLYLLFLELPHVVASFVGYADREYLSFYKIKLFIRLPLLLLVTVIIIKVNLDLGFVCYVFYTMYHSIKQQTGITSLLAGGPTTLHKVWSYVAIVVGIIGNFYVFAPDLTRGIFLFQTPWIFSGMTVVLAFASIAYIRSLTYGQIGFWYATATSLLVIASYGCVMVGYLFFAIFLIRFVHDSTAFIFYAVHDSNRNALTPKNVFYVLTSSLHIPVLIVTPLLGIVIAFYLHRYGVTYQQSATLVIILGFTHYYLESFMWKRESLHRKQLRFVS